MSVSNRKSLLVEHLPIQKQQRVERLVLGGRCDLAVDRQIAEKSFHFKGPHLARVPFAMEKDEPLNPVPVGRLSSNRVMLKTHYLADLVEELQIRDEICVVESLCPISSGTCEVIASSDFRFVPLSTINHKLSTISGLTYLLFQ